MNRELTKLSKPSKVTPEITLPSHHDTNTPSPSEILIEIKVNIISSVLKLYLYKHNCLI